MPGRPAGALCAGKLNGQGRPVSPALRTDKPARVATTGRNRGGDPQGLRSGKIIFKNQMLTF